MEYENMGELICNMRKEKNMTQRELADKLNVTDKAVSKWERDLVSRRKYDPETGGPFQYIFG